MAELDPRFGPAEQNCNVTREYLDELYGKADELRLLKRYLAALAADPDFACSIGGLDEWLSQNSPSAQLSRRGSTRYAAETAAPSTCTSTPRPHAAVF